MECITCKKELPESKFYVDRSYRSGRKPDCKRCYSAERTDAARERATRVRLKLGVPRIDINTQYNGEYLVYYLPEEHYVGMTNKFSRRMNEHRGAGKITDGCEVLAYFDNPYDCHIFETILHKIGYHGFNRRSN